MTEFDGPCVGCGRSELEPWARKGSLTWWICASCGSLTQLPRPSALELSNVYENYVTYKEARLPEYLQPESESIYEATKKKSLEDHGLDKDFFSGLEIVDLGCGTGQFLRFISQFDPLSMLGVDISQECVDECQAKGLRAVVADLDVFVGSFDLVCAFHFIEHLPHPLEGLMKIRKLIKPGGYLWLETPIVSAFARAQKDEWRYLYPHEHPSLFSFKALTLALKKLDLHLISYVTFGSGLELDQVSPIVKQSMDAVAKELGEGDTVSLLLKAD